MRKLMIPPALSADCCGAQNGAEAALESFGRDVHARDFALWCAAYFRQAAGRGRTESRQAVPAQPA